MTMLKLDFFPRHEEEIIVRDRGSIYQNIPYYTYIPLRISSNENSREAYPLKFGIESGFIIDNETLELLQKRISEVKDRLIKQRVTESVNQAPSNLKEHQKTEIQKRKIKLNVLSRGNKVVLIVKLQ